MAFFFCRLMPPRPTFPFDMTEEERADMGKHADYLRSLGEGGAMLMAGPVAEGQGAWGMAVFEAADEAELRTLTDADPVVRSGRGFSYEILPMLSAMFGSRLKQETRF
jgi:uncharacterized protein YciI